MWTDLTSDLCHCQALVCQSLFKHFLVGVQGGKLLHDGGKLLLDSGSLDHDFVLKDRTVFWQSRGLGGLLVVVQREQSEGNLDSVVRDESVEGANGRFLIGIVGFETIFSLCVLADKTNPPVHSLGKTSLGLQKHAVLCEVLGAVSQAAHAISRDELDSTSNVLGCDVRLLEPSLHDNAPKVLDTGVVAQSAHELDENFHAALHNFCLRPVLAHKNGAWSHDKILREALGLFSEAELGV
ncbi:hypothetical protein PG987_012454 [Apiospora arundinis]